MKPEDWIQMGMLLAACITIIYTRIQDRKQKQLMIFSEYTKRYQEILLNMPGAVFSGTGVLDGASLRHIRLYFDLCSEEYYMWKKGLVPNDIWEMWKEGMQITTKLHKYKIAWIKLAFSYNKEFYQYFNKEVINGKKSVS